MNHLSNFKKLLRQLHFYYDYYAYTIENEDTRLRVEHQVTLIDQSIQELLPDLQRASERRWATQYISLRQSFEETNSNYYQITMSTYKQQYYLLIDTLDNLVKSLTRTSYYDAS